MPGISTSFSSGVASSSCTVSMPAEISFSVVASPSSSFSTSMRARARACSTLLASSLFEIRSIFQPVSRAASRAFWPPLPMASDSWSSATITSMRFSGSCTRTSSTLAGDSARDTNTDGSCDHGTMSMRSPPSSRTMLCTREPLSPTHEPTASTRGSVEYTEIFERAPASRATALISTMLVGDLGHFALEQAAQEIGMRARQDDLRALGQLVHVDAPRRARSRPGGGRTRGICSRAGRKPSEWSSLTMTLPRSTCCTTPRTSTPTLSEYSLEHALALGLAHALDQHLLRGLDGVAAELRDRERERDARRRPAASAVQSPRLLDA